MKLTTNENIKEVFLAKVNKTESCWNWTANKDEHGYGKIRINGSLKSAHRISYELFIGSLGIKMLVCHKCDNPSCVNPEHLFLGTPKMNMIDMVDKGRSMLGEKHWNAKLSNKQILAIREDVRSSKEISSEYKITSVHVRRIKSKSRCNFN